MLNNYPIPVKLLIHKVKVTQAQESQANSLHPSINSSIHLFERVRVQPKDTASQTSNGAENKGSYLLFIDAVNSINTDNYLIKAGDRVQWNGVNRKVMGISAIYALNAENVHHWEVNLE